VAAAGRLGWAAAQEKERGGASGPRGNWSSRPKLRKRCRMNRNLFLFSKLIFQIKLSNVFEYLLNFDSNQSSQKYSATS
jgi:hypothetical protein